MKQKILIALSGNPNAGKTTAFNAITGARQHIANYPGVTVEKKIGVVHHKGWEIEVVDLPGTYSLTAYSMEEIVARDFVINEKPRMVVDIVDASNLDRHLYLAVQFKELGVPLILALNMVDVAESRGIKVDPDKLSEQFGVPVIPMVARTGKGIAELLDEVVAQFSQSPEWVNAPMSYGIDIDSGLDRISSIIEKSRFFDKKYPARWRALKCLEGDSQIIGLLKKDPELGKSITDICDDIAKHSMNTLEEEPEAIIADHRYGYIAGITKQVVKRKIELRINFSDKADRILTNRVLGPVIMGFILYTIYSFTFWASEMPLVWFEMFFDGLKNLVTAFVPSGILQSLLISGVIDGVGGVLGFVPLIMFMFFAIAIMEDSGYMARVAYMLDRVLRWFGLHGNSVMALVVSGGISGGCAVPGVMATRILKDPKERIATLLVVPFMNCGAKLPVYAMLIGAFFTKDKARMLFILTLISWGFALFAAKFLRATVLRGPTTPFVMELPPYRAPTFRGLLIHTWERTWQYIKKAGTVILAFSVILWAMMTFPRLSEERIQAFDQTREETTISFLNQQATKQWITDKGELGVLNRLYDGLSRKENVAILHRRHEPLLEVAKAALSLETEKGEAGAFGVEGKFQISGARYLKYRQQMAHIDNLQQQTALKRTIAGWIGMKLTYLTRPLGFEYRTNIALVGGFAAKEVIISTLGTAYSLSDANEDDTASLAAKLKRDPAWNPLQAFTLIIFIMLYVPCVATVASIRKESSWKWAAFSIIFNLAIAYGVSLVIRQGGVLLGMSG